MNFFNLLFLGKYGNYHKTNWFEALFAKVVGAGRKLIAKFLKIKGNTIVWNQMLDKSTYPSTQTINYVTWTNNGDGSFTANGTANDHSSIVLLDRTMMFTLNHKYLVLTGFTSEGSKNTFEFMILKFKNQGDNLNCYSDTIAEYNYTGNDYPTIQLVVRNGYTATGLVFRPQIFDLTAMFGSTKANEIYAMEQSQSGSGVAYFRSLFPLPYYQYEQGKLLSFGTPQQVTFNQMVDAPATSGDYDVQGVNLTYGTNTITLNSGTSTNGFKTAYNRYDLTSGHKYAVWGSPKNSNVNNYYLFIADSTGNTSRKAIFAEPVIYDCQVTENARLYVHVEQGATANHNVFQPQIIDLTVMYGSGKEPSIEYFRQVFNEDYYPYDSGSVVSANVSGIKTVGFNQWDEETTFGYFNITGIWTISNQHISSKNPIPVLPNTTYYCALVNGDAPIYITQWAKPVPSGVSNTESFIKRGVAPSTNNTFVTDPNCHAIHINCGSAYGTTYNNDICINISSDKNGTYEPYIESTVSIPTSTYFPTGMKDAGTAYDELTNSKAIKRINSFTIDGSAVTSVETASTGVAYAIINNKPSDAISSSLNIKTVSYLPINKAPSTSGYIRFVNSGVFLYDNAFTDLATAQSILNANPVTVYYESDTPTEVDIDPPLKLNYQVWEGGTEQLLPINTDVPVTSPILADIKYPDGERDNQYFTYRQYLPNSQMLGMALNTILGRSVSTEHTQEALDILMRGE